MILSELLCHFESKISKFHNQYSIKEILKQNNIKIKKYCRFFNVEIVSLEKLGAFYLSLVFIIQEIFAAQFTAQEELSMV